jgi:uncharacterized protein YbjT (DUF2867 family)
MYVSVRRYTIGAGSVDALARRLEREFAPALSQEPGFLGYQAIDTGDGELETISAFSDPESARRSEELAAAYVAEHLAEFEMERIDIAEGEVVVSRLTPSILSAPARRARRRRTSQPAPVVVAGATGRTGRRIVERLLERGIAVRALVRDAERARAVLPSDARLVVGDLRRRETLAPALTGAGVMIVATCGQADQENSAVIVDYFGTQHLMHEAVGAGLGLVVFVSSIHATRPEHYLDVEPTSLGWKARAEEVVRASGLPYVIVRAGWLTDAPGGEPLAVSQGDTGEGKLSRADLADACADLLTIDAARGKTFELVAARHGDRVPLDALVGTLEPDRLQAPVGVPA